MSEYGIWVSRKGYSASNLTNPKYLSFTGSLLTPKISTSASVAMTLDVIGVDTKTWIKTITITKTYIDENISLFGYYALYTGASVTNRVSLENPFECTSFINVTNPTSLSIQFEFYLTTADTFDAVDVEYFIFSDK